MKTVNDTNKKEGFIKRILRKLFSKKNKKTVPFDNGVTDKYLTYPTWSL